MPASAGFSEANSSGLCPLLGLIAVGGSARRGPIQRTTGNSATRLCPFVGPFTLVLWNSRSLWARDSTETIRFVLQMMHAHDITVLTETRESKERLVFLKTMLPECVRLFSSRIDQHRGGVAIIVQSRFLQHFAGKPKWRVFVKGRLARLEFSGAKGCLHVYAIYLSPEDPGERDKQLKRLADVIDPAVHNLITGDFNFVANDCDRINKAAGDCHSNAADKRNATTWKEVAATCSLKEFSQDEFTCENSYGWSRIDRLYTNLHAADLCILHSACNLLDHPRHLSDHKPVSLHISPREAQSKIKHIPGWVTEHASFKQELVDEYDARRDDFERRERRTPTAFEKLDIFKESAHRVAKYIRRICSSLVANTLEHKLAVSLSFLRAAHANDTLKAIALQKKCAELQRIDLSNGRVNASDLRQIKDLTVEWMRSDIRARAEELRKVKNSLPETIYEQRKKGLMTTLKSMAPGGSSDIAAMVGQDGHIVTDSAEIAKLLNDHWQNVFDHKPTNGDLRMKWLENIRGKFRVTKNQLRPSKAVVRQVIKDCGNSSPGPDAIPFEVYKALGEEAVELFWEAAMAMIDGAGCPGEDFNKALMVCIPKAADGATEDSTPYYSPGGTRPISIVDASNRILASIFCVVLEKRIGHRLHHAQKGFLKGRQMLRNVLDVDLAAQKVSVRSRSGAIVLFDFRAAFPSLSHDMIWDVLEVAGVDPQFIHVVKLFYSGNNHILKLRGLFFDGVCVKSGVRQGCPLSGILFAMCVDVLITKISGVLKRDEIAAAFADDLALVIEDFWIAAPALQMIFKEFQEISALALNIEKTVMIPLWPFSTAEAVRRLIREICPGWRGLEVARRGKYLGFILGPNSAMDAWSKPLAKFEQMVSMWASMRLGLAMNIVVFNVYLVPLLEYVAQILPTDERVHDAMTKAMRKLASGPGNWVKLQDLENLKSFGLHAELRTLDATAKAAKIRMVLTCATDARKKCRDLELTQSGSFLRPFGTWHQQSFYKILLDNVAHLEGYGLNMSAIYAKAKTCNDNTPRKKKLQAMIRLEIRPLIAPYNLEFRVREKIQRWRLEGPEATVADRIIRNCMTAGTKCRPCVAGTFFRTLWNGWPTSRRMRTASNATGVCSCLFGCTRARDELEHYLVCPVPWRILPHFPGVELNARRKTLQSMLLAEKGLDIHEIAAIAVGVYAIARTLHTVRRDGGEAAPLMRLHLQEGLRR